MSESMRLANDCKADRVDQFYAALHESAYSRKWRHVRVESETRSITDTAPLARRFMMLLRVVVVIRAFAIVSVFPDRAQD